MSSQAQHRVESLSVSIMLHKPARGLRTEIYSGAEDERWDKRGTELETPSDVFDVFDNNICSKAQENTCAEG
jgi:hypothetical protein